MVQGTSIFGEAVGRWLRNVRSDQHQPRGWRQVEPARLEDVRHRPEEWRAAQSCCTGLGIEP